MTPPPTNNDAWGGMSVGYSIVSYLLAGLLVGWGLGAGIDHLLNTPKVFTAILMLVGVGLGIYLVSLHYGKAHDERP
jgi:F0F1-type ATP synthase assembly protein I